MADPHFILEIDLGQNILKYLVSDCYFLDWTGARYRAK